MDHSKETNLEIKARHMLLGMLEIDLNLSNFRELGMWIGFRTMLVGEESIDHLRTTRSFKDGLFMVINIVDNINEIEALHNGDSTPEALKRFDDLSEFIYDHIMGECASGETYQHDAILKLIEVHGLVDPKKYGSSEMEATNLRLTLETIAKWQEALLKMHKELKK